MMPEKVVDENAPDTAKGKRQEASALRAEAGRLIVTAERLEALAEEQEPGKAPVEGDTYIADDLHPVYYRAYIFKDEAWRIAADTCSRAEAEHILVLAKDKSVEDLRDRFWFWKEVSER